MAKLCKHLKHNTPESPQWVGTQEVVETNVLVSCYVDHLENNHTCKLIYQYTTNIFNILLSLVYRLIGDNQLDDWQRIEHSNGSNVPGGESVPRSHHHLDKFNSWIMVSLSDMLHKTGNKFFWVWPRPKTWFCLLRLFSPKVDLVFLAENPLVFASQVGDTEKLLQQRKDKEGRHFCAALRRWDGIYLHTFQPRERSHRHMSATQLQPIVNSNYWLCSLGKWKQTLVRTMFLSESMSSNVS